MGKQLDKKKLVKVGDRVRFRIGAMNVVAEVVEDYGGIGVEGSQIVAVLRRTEEGETEKFDMPADDLTVEPRTRAAT